MLPDSIQILPDLVTKSLNLVSLPRVVYFKDPRVVPVLVKRGEPRIRGVADPADAQDFEVSDSDPGDLKKQRVEKDIQICIDLNMSD